MPVIACPKCPTQLKIPDGASGNVKCPKCAHIFPTSAPKPAFEVVDATPAPKPPPSKKAVVADASDDFEVVDEKPRKRRRDDDEDDDERPRGRSRRRDDDEDDDDRPRRKKRKRRDDYDDEDEDWEPPRKKRGNPLATAKTAAQLLAIGLWLYVGAFGLMALLVLVGWAGGDVPGGLMAVAGLVGLSNWIVSLVGLGFAIAGPERGRGMAIAATVVSAIHLVLCGVIYSNISDGLGALRGFGIGGESAAWGVFSSVLPALDAALPVLVYNSKSFGGDFLVAFLAAGCELARFILILLLLKELAYAARDAGAADKAVAGIMTVCGVCGGAAVLALLVVVLIYEGKLMRSALDLASASFLLIYVGYTIMTIFPALAAQDTKTACARRS